MQAQFYHIEDLKSYSKHVCDPSNNLSQDQIKTTLLKIIQNVQGIAYSISNPKVNTSKNKNDQSTPNGSITNTNQILSLIQMKIIQMEERRKAWDCTMAEIFNQKDQIKKNLDIKLNKIDTFEKGLSYLQSIVFKKFGQLDQERKQFKMTVQNKFNQTQTIIQSFQKDLNNQKSEKLIIEEEVHQIKDEIEIIRKQKQKQSKNQKYNFGIAITCSDRKGKKKQTFKRKKNQPEQEYSSTILEEQQNQNQNQIKKMTQTPHIQVITPKQVSQKSDKHQQSCGKIDVIIQNFQELQNLKNYINQNEQVIERFQNKIIILGQKIQKIQNKIGDLLMGGMINNASSNLSDQRNLQMNISRNQNSPQRMRQLRQYQSDPKNFIQILGYNVNKFRIQENLITYIDERQAQSCILLGCKSMRNMNAFTIQIVKSANGYIGIGISDERYHKIRDFWNEPNFFMMRGHKGEIYQGPSYLIRETGATFRPGDIVTVKVNFASSVIQWYVNGYCRDSFTSNKLKQASSIVWMPVIRFFNTGDSIRWIKQERTSDHI